MDCLGVRGSASSLLFSPNNSARATSEKIPAKIRSKQMVFIVLNLQASGTPEKIRTSDTRFRKPLLYPTELREHIELLKWVITLCNKGETLHCSLKLVNNGAFFTSSTGYFDIFAFTSFSQLSITVGTLDNCSSELIGPSKTTSPFVLIALSED